MVLCQFPWQEVSGSIAKTDLKQSKWKKSNLSNASYRTNPAVAHNPTNHDSGNLNVWNKWFFSF